MNSSFERLPTEIFASSTEGASRVAREISDLVLQRADEGSPAVLGLATGSTPVPVYRELIRMHREEGISFRHVITFNLDEYYPLAGDHRESYRRFMREQLFDHIDVLPENIHIPDGGVAREEAHAHCRDYEERINDAGGIDLQILGIGRTGHIGFNEPGSGRETRTRLVTLDTMTRRDAARDFLGEERVPRYAITMGVGTILQARRIILMAWGRGKASVVAEALEKPPSDHIPAGYLQSHEDAVFVLDESAASELTRVTEPWRVGFVTWDAELVRRAVIGLSGKVEKPVLKLVEKDYTDHSLADLLTARGSAYQINLEIFNVLQHTITGWPGGKPGADDSNRPERAEPAIKRVVVLAAEPHEDILGCGGTIRRLFEQGHEVTIAYATSGDLAVPDDEAVAALELARDLALPRGGGSGAGLDAMITEIGQKRAFDEDSARIRTVKGAIREGETRQAMRVLGLPENCLRFLRLPFYTKGRYRRFVVESEDIENVARLLREVRPHQVFVSGTEEDPSSVAGTVHRVFVEAFRHSREAGESWTNRTRMWLYRGSGAEWPVSRIDMAVPLSPSELQRKVMAAFQHRSQHSQSPYAVAEESEHWQQTEKLNRETARVYDALGMAEYEAIECFVREKTMA